MSVREDIAALCRIEAELKALEVEKAELRGRLLDHALRIAEEEGAAPTWRTDLGSVYLTIRKPRVEVYDEEEFAKAVEEMYGDAAVETVRRVRAGGLRDSVLSQVADGGQVPGVTARDQPPFIGVKLKKAVE